MATTQFTALAKKPYYGLNYDAIVRAKAQSLPSLYAQTDDEATKSATLQLGYDQLEVEKQDLTNQKGYYDDMARLSGEANNAAKSQQMISNVLGAAGTGVGIYGAYKMAGLTDKLAALTKPATGVTPAATTTSIGTETGVAAGVGAGTGSALTASQAALVPGTDPTAATILSDMGTTSEANALIGGQAGGQSLPTLAADAGVDAGVSAGAAGGLEAATPTALPTVEALNPINTAAGVETGISGAGASAPGIGLNSVTAGTAATAYAGAELGNMVSQPLGEALDIGGKSERGFVGRVGGGAAAGAVVGGYPGAIVGATVGVVDWGINEGGSVFRDAWNDTIGTITGDTWLCTQIGIHVGLSTKDNEDLKKLRYYCIKEHREWLKEYIDKGKELVLMVNATLGSTEKKELYYKDLLQTLVLPVLTAIRAGNLEDAYKIYKEESLKLFNDYTPGLITLEVDTQEDGGN